MVEGNRIELTEDEAELYDRQIRLWGLESQKRLRAAKVLVIGLTGLGAEVTKNIILAGVKSITLMDGHDVTEEDMCSQFLIPHSEVGKNRAKASVERAQQLNPMVEVKAVPTHPDDLTEPDFYSKFDIVCATGCSLPSYLKINSICREHKIKFFCADVFGTFGYHFSDLQNHEFAEEETKEITKPVISPTSINKRAKMEKETVKVTVKKTEKFVPLHDVTDIDWKLEENKKKLSTMDSSYFLMQVLLLFRGKYNKDPSPAKRDESLKLLHAIRDEFLAEKSVPADKVPDDCFRMVFAEVSPSCAIVGGVLSQEIIKVVSQKEAPHNNLFFFNPLTSCGTVVNLGSVSAQASKQEPIDVIDLDDD